MSASVFLFRRRFTDTVFSFVNFVIAFRLLSGVFGIVFTSFLVVEDCPVCKLCNTDANKEYCKEMNHLLHMLDKLAHLCYDVDGRGFRPSHPLRLVDYLSDNQKHRADKQVNQRADQKTCPVSRVVWLAFFVLRFVSSQCPHLPSMFLLYHKCAIMSSGFHEKDAQRFHSIFVHDFFKVSWYIILHLCYN